MAGWLSGAIVALRWPVVVFWIAAAIAATVFLPTIEEAKTGSLGELVANDAEAIDAEVRSNDLFGFPLLSRTLVVQRDPGGLSAAAHARVLRRVVGLNVNEYAGLTGVGGALAIANTLGEPPFSREASTTAITYLFFPPAIGPTGRTGLARRFTERHVHRPGDALVGVTGAVPARAEQVRVIQDALPWIEMATVMLVLVAVGWHFRALPAPLLNVAAVAISYLVASRVIAGAGTAVGVSVPEEVEPVIVVLLFGVMTDYAIFYLSRFRRNLIEEPDRQMAARRASAELMPTILTAGLTVVVASAALVVARLGFFRSFGPGMAAAVGVALMIAVTLLPAVMAIAGERLFWPHPPRPGAGPAGVPGGAAKPIRQRLMRVPTRRPLWTALAVLVPLIVAATGLMRLDVGNGVIRGLPDGAEPKQAYRAAARGFAPGVLSPTVILVEANGITKHRRELFRLQRLLRHQPGVAGITGPRQQPTGIELGAVYSRSEDAVRYLLVLNADPLGSAAIGVLRRIKRRMPNLLARAGIPAADFSFAGDTALSEETVRKTREDLARIAPVALVAVIAILAIFLRALVAPLYLVAASVLGLAASLGLTVYFFDGVVGYDDLTFYVPFAAAVLLLALGSDYNVFLIGQIWREGRRRPLRDAVSVAGASATAAITVAGLVLAASFALLGLVPLRPFRELAFAMTAGLLIDALLVRTMLVPALVTLIGERSGWPATRFGRRAVERMSRRPSVEELRTAHGSGSKPARW